MKKGNAALTFVALVVLSILGIYSFFPQAIRVQYDDSLKQFETCQEIATFVKTNAEMSRGFEVFSIGAPLAAQAVVESAVDSKAGGEYSEDYSTTNIQVEGVDEADIVKNDGKYIYVVSGNKIVIVDAYPAENAEILSELELNGTPQEIFINGDRLVVFGQNYYTYYGIAPERYYYDQTFIKIYDISDRSNPVIKRDVLFDGNYFDSRMIGDYVYLVINSYLRPDEIEMPEIEVDGETKPACGCEEIYYFDYPDYSYSVTSILSLNTHNDDEEIKSKNFLLGSTQNMFVSLNNIYVTYYRGVFRPIPVIEESSNITIPTEETAVHKISIKDGNIEYKTKGSVPGRVLNQF